MELLPKHHSILEKGSMEYRPFGQTPNGAGIRDVSGITVRANVEFLEEVVSRTKGWEAGQQAVLDLVSRLNARIPETAYHVTPEFLKNPWNSYSYEFVMYISEFCVQLTEDPMFPTKIGREKFLSPIIQVLGRPFSLVQIYRLYPYFVEKFTKGALLPEVISVTDGFAVMRLRLGEHTATQFGPYRHSCADRICQTTKATIAETPARMFGLKPAIIEEPQCMGDGAEYCEWRCSWQKQGLRSFIAPLCGLTLGSIVMLFLHQQYPALSVAQQLGLSALSGLLAWTMLSLWSDRKEIQQQRDIIREQLQSMEARHEELREAYVKQEHTAVELRRHIQELTMLYHIGLRLNQTLDRQALISTGLEVILEQLHYDRVMLYFYDHHTHIAKEATILGVPDDTADWVHTFKIPVTDPESLEGTVFLKGNPILVDNVAEIRSRLHPLHQRLIRKLHTKSFIAVPLKVGERILGALVVDRSTALPLTQANLHLLSTVGNQLALALDHADAYAEIEALNVGLEVKVQHRTHELERLNRDLETANQRLQELDRMKSQFLSHCSHELRTPLTSIKGFAENLLHGIGGNLTDKQLIYLTRINANADRLTRMISDLLDLSRIESGTVQMNWQEVSVFELVTDVVNQLSPIAHSKHQRLDILGPDEPLVVKGDSDRLTQILTNLVHNATKFSPDGGHIHIVMNPGPHHTAMISIHDTGPGIPSEALPKLFTPFFQAHRDQEIGVQGLGLGLTIVKNLIDLHDGSITVERGKDQGLIFRVLIPLSVPMA